MKSFARCVFIGVLSLAMQGTCLGDDELVDNSGNWRFTVDGANATLVKWLGESTVTTLDVPTDLSYTVDDVTSNYVVRAVSSGAINIRDLREIWFPDTVASLAEDAITNNRYLEKVTFDGPKPALSEFWFGSADSGQFTIYVSISESSWSDLLAAGQYVETHEYQGETYTYVFPVKDATYDETCTVEATPAPGFYLENQDVAITSTRGELPGMDMRIYYTVDGSSPSLKSPVYDGSFVVSSNTTVKCFVAYFDSEHGMLSKTGPTASFTYSFPMPDGGPYKEVVGGLEWTFRIKGGKSFVTRASHEKPAIAVETAGTLAIPNMLGGRTVVGIDVSAMERCRYLTSVTFPSSVTNISSFAFKDCLRLSSLVWQGERPVIDLAAFDGCPLSNTGVTPTEPKTIYVPIEVLPDDTGAVPVPESWLDNMAVIHGNEWKANYIARFGSDFTNSLMQATGKTDAYGNEMYVWQDYVAGTDPLNASDVLRASITMTDGTPHVTWLPDLSSATPARVYKVYGMKTLGARLSATDVTSLLPADRKAEGYRFFYVTVTLATE